MKIHVTLDCIKLTGFETMLLAAIKGICHDYRQCTMNDERFNKEIYPDINITIKESDRMIFFNVENSPRGLFRDIENLIKPFKLSVKLYGLFKEEIKTTVLVLQRFNIESIKCSWL